MLVLTRKHQEKIRIGNDITITILRTKGKAVRLGIEAPAEVPVIRGELSFDVAPAVGDQEDSELEVAENVVPAALVHRSRSRVHETRTDSNWSIESHPAVSLQRVSRGEVAKVLPQLASGAAPLRAMVEMRSVAR
jgi:carbon storage regulator